MKTYLDCIPCFFKQALEAARLAGANQRTQKRILEELALALPGLSLSSSPPEIGRVIYGIVNKITHKHDPFKKIKEKSNRLALKIYPELKNKVSSASDRLLMALELAIAGNIIDYGVKNSLSVEKELSMILNKENEAIKRKDKAVFDYLEFKHALNRSKTIIYLADNAGETVFDRILIEEIRRLDKNKRIIYTVKGKPIINDALIEDARKCGLDKVAEIASCGLGIPGTVISLCSVKFLRIYKKADMVISKGQGNFESFSDRRKSVFFLFMVKCPVVAKDVGCNIGDIILLYNLGTNYKR